MSSSSNEFTHKKENSKTDVPVGFRLPYLYPSKGHKHGVSIQSLTILRGRFPNISHMNYDIDLILGEAFFTFIFFHFPDSELSVLTGLHFYF